MFYRWSSSTVNSVHDQPVGALYIHPLPDAGPFPWLQVLIVIEEMRDLLAHDLRQIQIRSDTGIERVQIVDRNGNNLLIKTSLVLH